MVRWLLASMAAVLSATSVFPALAQVMSGPSLNNGAYYDWIPLAPAGGIYTVQGAPRSIGYTCPSTTSTVTLTSANGHTTTFTLPVATLLLTLPFVPATFTVGTPGACNFVALP